MIKISMDIMEEITSVNMPENVVWVPCLSNYATGELIPLYTLNDYALLNSPVQPLTSIPRGGTKSKEWTDIEDKKLIELVSQYGTKKWAVIAKELNKIVRNNSSLRGKHCRERWYNHLNPEINSNF